MAARQLVWANPLVDGLEGRRFTSASLVWGALFVTLLLVTATGVVYWSGGTMRPFPHLLYLPIVISAYLFGLPGSLVTALVAGFAVGPFMPLSTVPLEMQGASDWLTRLAFYLAAGAMTGLTSSALQRQHVRLSQAVEVLEDTHSATLKAFTSVVETHDGPTGEHCERVARNALALGEALALDSLELDQLYWAGILHDVGKVAVPGEILQKPGKLTAQEYEQVKAHPAFGARLLRSISTSFEPVAVGVETHHEKWDGTGYPHGLAGSEIPLFGRILAIVDVFEAITGERPYRDASAPEEALLELRKGAGKHFDRELVALYERLYWGGRIQVAGIPNDSQVREPKLTAWLTMVEA